MRFNFWNNNDKMIERRKTPYLSTFLKQLLVYISRILQKFSSPLFLHLATIIQPVSTHRPEAIRLISIESSVQADSSRRFRFDRSRAIWTRARLPAASQTMHLLRDRLPRECLNNDRGEPRGLEKGRSTEAGRGKLVNGHRSKTFEPFPGAEHVEHEKNGAISLATSS